LGGEQCIINANGKEHFFIRACLEIPIHGSDLPFVWGVWCVGERPLVELESAEHALSVHQRFGVEQVELQGIVQEVLHAT